MTVGGHGAELGIKYEEGYTIQVHSIVQILELNTPAALELVLMCHLGPRTRKIEIYHPKLIKLCHLGTYPLT